MSKGLEKAIPKAVCEILERLEAAAYSAYAVGGCVRDVLMGREVNDWDLCSAASPEQVMEVFSDCRCIPTGLEHGTVTIIYEGTPYELTMFRRELDYDGRRPATVLPASTIEEDILRRDFTVNAMAYSPKRGLVDICHSQEDLQLGLLRAVGAAEERFREDYLRILRGLRFAACCGFSIEENTGAAMFRCASGLSKLSAERIWQELHKLLHGDDAGTVLEKFYPVLRSISKNWESFTFNEKDSESFRILPKITACRLAFLLDRLDDKKQAALDELRCTTELKAQVKLLWEQRIFLATSALPQEWLSRFPEKWRKEGCEAALHLSGKEKLLPEFMGILEGQSPLSAADLAIGGKDLLALGFKGKEVGESLNQLLRAVWLGEVKNDREELEQYLCKSVPARTRN